MGNISLPHAFTLSFLLLAITIIAATADLQLHATFHSLPYFSAPTHSPSQAPSHHHHHHHSHHVTASPAHSPTTTLPAKPPISPPLLHAKPPTQPPVKSPVHPVKPPTKAPAPAPGHVYSKPPAKAPALAPYNKPPRKLVAVEGAVYCKNCSHAGVNTTLLGASPLSGATVELRCRNTKYMLKKAATTDKNGYFFLQAPKYITTYGAHKCLVFLIQNPNNRTAGGACSHATNLNGGVSGAFLFLDKTLAPPTKALPFSLYTVGPFAFEPHKCYEHQKAN